MTSDAPLLGVRELVKDYRGTGLRRGRTVRAVDGVSLAVAAGETLALVGESGSGKTTVGRCILRLVTPTAGEVHLAGQDVHAASAPALRRLRRRMQAVFQDPSASLNPRHRIGEIVTEGLRVHRLAPRSELGDRAAALLREVGLDPVLAGRRPHECSGGQRQRVAIARALAVEPELLVLDEPVTALDVSVQAQVLGLLAELQARRGLAYLFIAHDLAVVRAIAHRVAVMRAGRILEEGPTEQVLGHPSHPYTQALRAAAPVPDPAVRP